MWGWIKGLDVGVKLIIDFLKRPLKIRYLIWCTVIIHWKCTIGICPVDEVFICFSAQQTYHWRFPCNESKTTLQITIKRHYSQKNHCNDNCNDFSDYNDIIAPLDKQYHLVLRGGIKLHILQSNYFDNLLTKVTFPDMRIEWWWCWQRRRRWWLWRWCWWWWCFAGQRWRSASQTWGTSYLWTFSDTKNPTSYISGAARYFH